MADRIHIPSYMIGKILGETDDNVSCIKILMLVLRNYKERALCDNFFLVYNINIQRTT